MTQDPFSTSSEVREEQGESTFVKFRDLSGSLLLITPTQYDEEVDSKFPNANKNGRKVQDRITADVVVVDEKSPADSVKHEHVWIGYGRCIAALKPKVKAGMLLGNLVEFQVKDSTNIGYQLDDPTEAQKVAARAYLDSVKPSFD